MTTTDLLVLVPWLAFAIGLAVIGCRLLGRHCTAARRDRGSR